MGFYWGYNPLIQSPLIRSLPSRDILELRAMFTPRYSAGSKETLIYRREQGKSLDAWVEGLDMANQEILGFF